MKPDRTGSREGRPAPFIRVVLPSSVPGDAPKLSMTVRRRAMFVYYYVHVDLPFLEAWARLSEALGTVAEWASDAYRGGEVLRAKAGPRGAHVAKTVAIHVHDASVGDGTVTIPMTWTATGSPGLFPKLEADLMVGAIASDVTQVALRGSYTPPLGSVGRALDRLVLHRVAEATIKAFVDRIAEALSADRTVAARA